MKIEKLNIRMEPHFTGDSRYELILEAIVEGKLYGTSEIFDSKYINFTPAFNRFLQMASLSMQKLLRDDEIKFKKERYKSKKEIRKDLAKIHTQNCNRFYGNLNGDKL